MVVFTCNHCGESLQKPRVEKHYNTQCRRAKSLTCVDCFKDFKNEEYVVHTKCITEEERYGAKGSIPGGVVKKGEVKQESWTDMIRSVVESEANLKPSLKKLFDVISSYSNVPRKKVKFINFLKNSSGGRVNSSDIEAAWDLIEKYKSEQNKNNSVSEEKEVKTETEESGTKKEQNEINEEPSLKKKKKKNKDHNKTKENGTEHLNENNEEPSIKKKKHKNKDHTEAKENGTEHLNGNNEEPLNKKIKHKNKNHSETEENGTEQLNGNNKEIPVKRRKLEKTNEEVEIEGSKFSFKNTILNILSHKGTISCKKLQKKVLNAYLKETGNTENTERTVKKYNKKLKSLPNIVISDDTVTLTSES